MLWHDPADWDVQDPTTRVEIEQLRDSNATEELEKRLQNRTPFLMPFSVHI